MGLNRLVTDISKGVPQSRCPLADSEMLEPGGPSHLLEVCGDAGSDLRIKLVRVLSNCPASNGSPDAGEQSGSHSFWRSAIRLCSTSAPTGGTLPNLRAAQAKGAIAHLAMHPRHCGEPALWTDFKVPRSAYPLAEGHRSARTTRRKPRWSG